MTAFSKHLPHRHCHNYDDARPLCKGFRVGKFRTKADQWISDLDRLRPSRYNLKHIDLIDGFRRAIIDINEDARAVLAALQRVTAAHDLMTCTVQHNQCLPEYEMLLRTSAQMVHGNVRECSSSIDTMRTNLRTLMAQLESLPGGIAQNQSESKWRKAFHGLSTVLKSCAIVLAGSALVVLCAGVAAPAAAAIGAAAALVAAAHLLCKSIEEAFPMTERSIHASLVKLRTNIASQAQSIAESLDTLKASLDHIEKDAMLQMGRHWLDHLDESQYALLALEPDLETADVGEMLDLETKLASFFEEERFGKLLMV